MLSDEDDNGNFVPGRFVSHRVSLSHARKDGSFYQARQAIDRAHKVFWAYNHNLLLVTNQVNRVIAFF